MKYLTSIVFITLIAMVGCKKEQAIANCEIISPVSGSVFHSGDSIPVVIRCTYINTNFYGDTLIVWNSNWHSYPDSLKDINKLIITSDSIYYTYMRFYTATFDSCALYWAIHAIRPESVIYQPQATIYILP